MELKLRIIFLISFCDLLMIFSPSESRAQIVFKVKSETLLDTRIKGEIKLAKKDTLYLFHRKKNYSEFLAVSKIKSLRIKRKGATRRGLIIGAGSGALLGGFLGLAMYSPTPDCKNIYCFDYGPEDSVIGGAISGFVAGAIFGGLIGTSGKKFQIDGDTENFEKVMEYINSVTSKRTKKRIG